MELILILGNQLFDPKNWPAELKKINKVFMREDFELCTYFKFHKHKIVFFLSAMREFKAELEDYGKSVEYQFLEESKSTYINSLKAYIDKNKVKKIFTFEIEDKFFESRILDLAQEKKIEIVFFNSPMFLTPRNEFSRYLTMYKKPFMKSFYEGQRKRFGILVDKNNKPTGGQWSFDEENRLPLPKDVLPPEPPKLVVSQTIIDVNKICNRKFPEHPGDVRTYWIPVTRKEAKSWLKNFLKTKLSDFGPYEDALAPNSNFVFHSILTPFLNVGLLTPDEVVKETLTFCGKHKVPLASQEGFLRQVIGWREFIRGIYQNFSEVEESTNFWNHSKKLSDVWYNGSSSLPQLSRTLKKVIEFSYCHHIERLMVLGNLMLLLGVDPKEAHKWFMEMFIDSSDWVMGPNVYGMALFSDGGVFATKPYICGSNYWRKMSKEPAGDWCDGVDGLYWRFIDKNRTFFSKNPRLSMMVRSLDKMDQRRKKQIYSAADNLIRELTI